MEYQEFVEQIKQKVTEQAEAGSKVSVSRILKKQSGAGRWADNSASGRKRSARDLAESVISEV